MRVRVRVRVRMSESERVSGSDLPQNPPLAFALPARQKVLERGKV